MPEVKIAAQSRTEFGKGAARRIRRDHKIPAVVYGHGADPIHITLPGHELMLALKTPNVLLELQLDSGEQLTLPKSVQRDPVRHTIEHVDLVLVRKGEKVVVEVPVVEVGAAEPGGLLETVIDTLRVEAEATHIPQRIEVSIQGLAIGGTVVAGDIVLPEGTTLVEEPDAVVFHYLEPQVTATDDEAEAAEGTEGEPAAATEE